VPPQPFDQRWYIHADQQTYGPFTGNEIRQMTTKGQIVESDLVYAEDGNEWVQVKDDPTLRLLFIRGVGTPTSARRASATRHRLTLPLGALFLLIIVWMVWPYYAVYKLAAAFRLGDVPALESGVAWDSVRQGLKSDINALFLHDLSSDAGKKNNEPGSALGTGLAAVLAPAIINQLVDGYVTPQAVAASISRGADGAGTIDAGTPQNNFAQAVQSARKVGWNQVEYMFFSGDPFTFRVQIRPERDPPLKSPVTLILNWSGNWKLTRILLPANGTGDSASSSTPYTTSEQPNNVPSQVVENSTKTSAITSTQETPLEISLVSKGFKGHNYQASDFEDDITFGLLIKNVSGKDIRAFDGVRTFTDLLDNRILSSKLAINDPVSAGSTMNWAGVIKYNQFTDAHQRLRNEAQANLKIKFDPGKVLFADGNTKVYDKPAN